jgi:DNA-directed RNA polymerase alpha subunit
MSTELDWWLEFDARDAALAQKRRRERAERIARGETPVSELKLSTRTFNVLDHNDIGTVDHLASLTERELVGLRNCGRKTVSELRGALRTRRLDLAGLDLPQRVAELERTNRGKPGLRSSN